MPKLKELIATTNKLKQVMDNVYWKGQREHPEKMEFIEALSSILSILGRIDEEKIEKILPRIRQRKTLSHSIVSYLTSEVKNEC